MRKGLGWIFLMVAAALPVAAAEEGGQIYSAKCASCHGPSGKGNPAMAKVFKVEPAALNLADSATSALKDEDLKSTISKGRGKMPAYAGKVPDTEIAALVSYIRGLSGATAPSPKTEKPAAVGVDAATLYGSKCASCHGPSGKGNPAMAKVFKVNVSALDLTDSATLGKSDDALSSVTSKGVGKMPAFDGKMKDEEISALINYLRSLAKK